jgi:16S rRNA G966 N2-methylase RsmD
VALKTQRPQGLAILIPRRETDESRVRSGHNPVVKVAPNEPRSVFVGPVRVSRATSIYNVHAYHTKVPVGAIRPYIRHYTDNGGIVLDPFAGSGMTGLAAALEGRRAILNDLSPAAVHIARNYTTPCDPAALAAAARRLLSWASPQIEPHYVVSCPGCSGRAVTEYAVWSDIRRCPACEGPVSVWTARSATAVKELVCPACATRFDKNSSGVLGEQIVSVNLSCEQCVGRRVIEPRQEDADAADVATDRRYWYPDLPFGSDWEMWRRGHRDLGITRVSDFWSQRNLAALAVLWAGIGREKDPRLADALRFVFTAIVNRASRRYQWNAKRPTNVLGGTLYVSSLRYEFNVLSLFRRKLRAAMAFYQDVSLSPGLVEVRQGSATDLRSIPTGTIDYCFTDPPFGANIYYADSSLLWEAWLGALTDRSQEAVVSRKRPGKSIDAYRELMARSMAEMRRCLKTDGVVTMVFQNTDEAVWQALREAASDAGLHVLAATTLHKAQPSFKGVKAAQKGERVAATDVVLTMAPQPRDGLAVTEEVNAEAVVMAAIETELAMDGNARVRSVPHLYAVAVSALLDAGLDPAGWDFERVDAVRASLSTAESTEQLALGIGQS